MTENKERKIIEQMKVKILFIIVGKFFNENI
jgi:hypothetical protein